MWNRLSMQGCIMQMNYDADDKHCTYTLCNLCQVVCNKYEMCIKYQMYAMLQAYEYFTIILATTLNV